MADALNQNSTANFAYLLDFLWGESNAHTAYYTSWDSPVTVGSITYGCDPQTRVEVQPGKQTGIVRDEPWMVTLPPLAPLTSLARPFAFAPVTSRIWEVDPTAGTPAPTLMWQGIISKVIVNPRGKPGCIQYQLSGNRVNIQFPMSIEAKTGCTWVFGDPRTCQKDLSTIQQSAVITSLSGKTLAASSLTIPGGMPATWWTAGKIYIDGLTIAILDGSGFPNLSLLLAPPPEWNGATAVFTPGCDRTIETCRVMGRETSFMGLGIRSPSFNPIVGMR
jgi:hypothetical protein